jgi:hypothetical protein
LKPGHCCGLRLP